MGVKRLMKALYWLLTDTNWAPRTTGKVHNLTSPLSHCCIPRQLLTLLTIHGGREREEIKQYLHTEEGSEER